MTDHAALFLAKKNVKPGDVGTFTWVVPNKFRCTGEGDGIVFETIEQNFILASPRRVTVTKYGLSTP
ncbi:MAG: hypothetical protein H0V44_07535 [Planctomycetes bacterium]|nr:hypothetical protein [Planctomycetota bacterium]